MSDTERTQTVLIVEDERPLASALSDELGRAGFAVEIAHNGEEGLALSERLRPALILLDIMMPKMDGLSMLRALRSQDWGSQVKVIMLTNADDTGKVSEAVVQGSFEYLIKADWKIEDIVEKVRKEVVRS